MRFAPYTFMLRLNSRFNRRSIDFLLNPDLLGSSIPDCAHRPYVHPNNKKSDDHVDPEIVVYISYSKSVSIE